MTKKELEAIKHRIDYADKTYAQLTQVEQDRKALYEFVISLQHALRQDEYELGYGEPVFVKNKR